MACPRCLAALHDNSVTVGAGNVYKQKSLRKRRLAGSITGFVRRAASVRECENIGAVDVALTRDDLNDIEGALSSNRVKQPRYNDIGMQQINR